MNIIGDVVNTLLLAPTINLLVAIIRGLESLHLPGALGLSIILLTVLIKIILWPITVRQLVAARKMSEKMAIMKPELEELKTKYKDDKMALAQAQREIYAKYEINPAAGCLPIIIQALLIYPIYQVVIAFLDLNHGLERINYFIYNAQWHLSQLPDSHFLGLDLAAKPSDFSKMGVMGIYLLAVPVVTALFQFILTKMMSPFVQKETEAVAEKVETKKEAEDTAAAMQKQMTYMMPLMIGFFAWQLPVGLALYWNVLNVVSLIQQYRVSGWGSLRAHVPSSSAPKPETKVTVVREVPNQRRTFKNKKKR